MVIYALFKEVQATDTNLASNDIYRHTEKKKILGIFPRRNKGISEEDHEIVNTLNMLNDEIKSLHSGLDNITDPALIDAYIYEIKAVNMRYKYYLEICKRKGIVADVF